VAAVVVPAVADVVPVAAEAPVGASSEHPFLAVVRRSSLWRLAKASRPTKATQAAFCLTDWRSASISSSSGSRSRARAAPALSNSLSVIFTKVAGVMITSSC